MVPLPLRKNTFGIYVDVGLLVVDCSLFSVRKYVDGSCTEVLKETCDKAGIAFFTSPYSEELLNHIDPYVTAHKIGSGDITWLEMVESIAKKISQPYLHPAPHLLMML